MPVVECRTASAEEVAMLAEIFLIQLEAAVRASEQRAPVSNRFVPFIKSGQSFKGIRDRVVEATRERFGSV